MKRFLVSLLLSALAVASIPSGAVAQTPSPGHHPLKESRFQVRPLHGVSSASLDAQTAAAVTVPTWSSLISSLGHTYSYRMVGKKPSVHQLNPSTTVTADLIPVSLTFDDSGVTFDPTASDPTCSPAGTAKNLTAASPIFKKHAYAPGGTAVGTVQYLDAFQRENFWKFIRPGGLNPGYHVVLNLVSHPVIPLEVATDTGLTVQGNCGPLGLVDIDTWDKFVQTNLFPQLSTAVPAVTPTHFAIFLFYNVAMFFNGNPNDCCALGYHSAFPSSSFGGAVQTYSTADFETSQSFSGRDVSALSHEVGEWMDDPFGNNPTPAWGHTGQITGCSSLLEVGDPLTGKTFTVLMPNGFKYHLQELAFFSWFYRQKPSLGVNGWYSSRGTFRTTQPICH
jgi:hypothetical protein